MSNTWFNRLKRVFKGEKEQTKPKIDSSNYEPTSKELDEWQTRVKSIADHPLSQAKIINAQILEMLTNILSSMDHKLSNLDKLNDILTILKQNEYKIENIEKEKKDLLSIKDNVLLNVFKDGKKYSSLDVSDLLKISRSTSSFRLNRLYSLGILQKEPIGKKIFFYIKKD